MTKKQFMEELRSSLEGMVSPMVLDQNLNYYESYINDQIRNGKSETEVLNELGSPRLIARSIIDAAGNTDGFAQSDTYTSDTYADEEQEANEKKQRGWSIFLADSSIKLGCLLSVVILLLILYVILRLFRIAIGFFGPVIIIGVIVIMFIRMMER